MARKVLLDVDPGVDDAAAICLALADRDLDVVAVTAVAGNVRAEQATRNVQAIVEQLDPSRWPRLGAASPERMLRVDGRDLFGADGLCGADFPVAELHHRHPSTKVISDEVRTAPGDITIVACGPLSNIAVALQQQPDLASLIGHLIVVGGTLSGPGDVTAASEFNIYCDAEAARDVFDSSVTKTLVPLDIIGQVLFGFDLLKRIPDGGSRKTRLLQKLLPNLFRTYRQQLGLEGIYLHACVGVVAAAHPELFTTERLSGSVETEGVLTHGATVFDRRRRPEGIANMDVAVDVDADKVVKSILDAFDASDG